MQHFDSENLLARSEAHFAMETAVSIVDHRFAVVSEQLFELVSYNGCADGHSYDVLTVFHAVGAHSPGRSLDGLQFIEAFVWRDQPTLVATEAMLALMKGRLERF